MDIGTRARQRLTGKEAEPVKAKPIPRKEEAGIKVPDWVNEAKEYDYNGFLYETPSQSPFPVFTMCQPLYVDTKIANNKWMKELNGKAKEMDKEKFMGEWYNFYKLVASDSLVILIPPKKGLQDQVYVNCYAYLPHVKDRDTIVLSNFTAEGRAGEELVARELFIRLGYRVYSCPFKFEGFPELKYLKDNIYFGGYGFRTDPRAYDWMEKQFGMKVIRLKEKDEHLYHLDCTLFVVDEDNIILCSELFESAEVTACEKACKVHAVTKQACHENACNNVRVGDMILTSSSEEFMTTRNPNYKKEAEKNRELEQICCDLGIELMTIEMTEAGKSGAALSCMISPLNVRI